MTSTKLRCAIYVRLSQDATGEGVQVERQQRDCVELAKRLGWTVVHTFDDNDLSAFTGKDRPGFDKLLAAVKRRDIDAICCYHPDRLYRRIKDLQRLVDIAESGVRIASVNGGEVDLSNASGRMIATILGSVAEMESSHKGERQRSANAHRATAGLWRADGPRPFGYTQGGRDQKKQHQPGVPLEPEAQAVRDAARDVLDGVSLRSICMKWNEQGLRTPKAATGERGGVKWSNLTLRRLLMRPLYCGYRTYKGSELVRGDWEPLFSLDTWEALVALLTDESRRRSSRFVRLYQGSGIYICGKCGARLYASHPHGRNRTMVYQCRDGNGHLGRVAGPVDTMVEAVVVGVLTRDGMAERLTARPGINVEELNARRSVLVAQRGQLAKWFTTGVLDGPGVEAESAKLAAQIDGIDETLHESFRRSVAATLLVDGPGEVWRHWSAASPDLKGKVIDELMTITVLPSTPGARKFDPDLIDIQPKV